MPNRQALYVRRERAKLIERLGGKCALCGVDEKLEFDHIVGRDWSIHDTGSTVRINKYKREADAGLIRLLCGPCNLAERKKNDNGQFVKTNSNPELTDNIPF